MHHKHEKADAALISDLFLCPTLLRSRFLFAPLEGGLSSLCEIGCSSASFLAYLSPLKPAN